MENWKIVTAAVAVFAFSLEFRPMDSFLTAYLTSPEIHATLSEVSDVLTPIRIQFGVIGTFLVFLLADYLRYKPIMIFNGTLGMLAYACLMGSPTIFRLKVVEVCLSLFTCAEVSYYGYLFAKIKEKEQYQTATGCAKAGMLSGKFASGILGQAVVYFNNHDYSTLPYYSFTSMTFVTVWGFLLPSVRHSQYFHAEEQVIATTTGTVADDSSAEYFSKKAIQDPNIPKYIVEKDDRQQNVDQTIAVATNPFKRIYEDFKYSYKDTEVLWWSFWHIVGLFGYAQIILYINVLYTYEMDVSDDKNTLYNGLVDSIATMSAAICAYKIGKANVDWTRRGDMFLAISSLTLGLTMCLCYFFKNIFLVYAMFIFYDTLVESTFVIVISQIAKRLRNDCYTLILGFNAFVAVVLCTLSSTFLTAIRLSIPAKFLAYGGTYVTLGIIYGCAAVYKRNTAVVVSRRRFHRIP
ncbi:Hypothetical protein CINCED_3A001855 [Cinara cedri]|nr:Hypothetical protein CINCED_3A001855 [Cinara cedri]